MLTYVLKKSLLRPVRFGCDVLTHTRDAFNMALGRDKRILSQKQGKLKPPSPCRRAAVVAMYPGETCLPFIINLMKGLHENGFFVLAVVAKQLDTELTSRLLEDCHVLIERFPMGRDFGSYKMGLEWLEKQPFYKDLELVGLVNDSMFYPRHITETIRELLTTDGNWLALYENWQTRRHVQSFFELFRASVFRSKPFKSFWRSYLPLSSRTHGIGKGETGLSERLGRAGFDPYILYSSLTIREALSQCLRESDATALYEVAQMALSARGQRPSIKTLISPQDAAAQEATATDPEDIAAKVARLAETFNPTHSVGLICNMLFAAPIKRDVCFKGAYHFCDLMPYVRGFSDQEKDMMANDIRRRGLPASFPRWTWRGLKISAGVD